MSIAALSSEITWEKQKIKMREWASKSWDERMAVFAPPPTRRAFMVFIEMLEADPPAGDEGVLLEALYDTLRNERYLLGPSPGRYRVEGEGESLRVLFSPGDIMAYLDERIDWLAERAREGSVLAGHYRDAVRLIRKGIFGGE